MNAMRHLADFIKGIIFSLWERGYTLTLQERIISILRRNNYFNKQKIRNYLDLGSGASCFCDKVSSLFRPLSSFTADIIAPQSFAYRHHIICNFNERFLPFKEDSFDLITCINVIEHLFDTDKFLLEVRRILKRGGVFIIATNNISCWTNILALIFGKQPNANHISDYGNFGRFLQKDFIREGKSLMHRRIFSLPGLKRVLEFHDFEVVLSKRCVFYPFSGCLEKLLEKILGVYCAYILFVCKVK